MIIIIITDLAVVEITITNNSTTNIKITAGFLALGTWTAKPPSSILPSKSGTAVVR